MGNAQMDSCQMADRAAGSRADARPGPPRTRPAHGVADGEPHSIAGEGVLLHLTRDDSRGLDACKLAPLDFLHLFGLVLHELLQLPDVLLVHHLLLEENIYRLRGGLRRHLRQLQGRRLVCHCAPLASRSLPFPRLTPRRRPP